MRGVPIDRRLGATSVGRAGLTSDDDNKAILELTRKPGAGRLVWVPWQAGGLCLPKMQEDKGEADFGGRC